MSLGGAIALQVAIDDPARVAGLLVCGPYGVDPHMPGGTLGWLTVHTPGVDALTWWTMRHSRRAVRATLGTVLRRPITDELVDEVQTLARTPDAGVAWRAFQCYEVRFAGPRTVFGDALAGIECPALLLAGEHDIVPPAAVRAAAARIPRGEFAMVPGAGHWLPRDAPGSRRRSPARDDHPDREAAPIVTSSSRRTLGAWEYDAWSARDFAPVGPSA